MQGQSLDLHAVTVRFGDVVAVQPTTLSVAAGEFLSILGPSGCGKTTLLRVVAGFQPPSGGRVVIGDEDVTGRAAATRPTAMIFQSLALFPLMPVWENVAFGLQARGMGRSERRRRAGTLLELVALRDYADRLPGQLSGGQRQRVAIARALAVSPAVLLLDEPLSALDLKLRQHMRAELRALQRRTGVTFVYITHDQNEALAMSDRVAVMNRGAIVQVDSPARIYAAPATPFVATFVGESNVLVGTVAHRDANAVLLDTPVGRLAGRAVNGLVAGDRALAFLRPEGLRLGAAQPGDITIAARLESVELEGPTVSMRLRAGSMALHATAPNLGQHPVPGDDVPLAFHPRDIVVLPDGELAS